MPQFHVWITIEEYDAAKGPTNASTDREAPGGPVATLPTYEQAWQFATRLQAHGYVLAQLTPPPNGQRQR